MARFVDSSFAIHVFQYILGHNIEDSKSYKCGKCCATSALRLNIFFAHLLQNVEAIIFHARHNFEIRPHVDFWRLLSFFRSHRKHFFSDFRPRGEGIVKMKTYPTRSHCDLHFQSYYLTSYHDSFLDF